ncbi:MAG: hypothetical protein NTU45_04685 [Planctomycetota bacterium]|nr:hypothetical protein [Planctomycetota bacterium]
MAAKKSTTKKPTTTSVIDEPASPKSELLTRSHLILCDGIRSVNSLAGLYATAQKARGGGAPTHEEQDLLRAMVVMSGAALDATLKRAIRDCLAKLTKCNSKAREEATKHIKRRILSSLDGRGGERLAQVMLSDNPRDEVVGFVIDDTTGDSLQSKDEVLKVVQLLGLEKVPIDGLQDAFETRNQIIHEMDAVDAEKKGDKRRRQRKQETMTVHARSLLAVAAEILGRIDAATNATD